ncbi:hypothetical protein bcere0029_16680 [Bacillus cereus AH1272]|nr:hypothetical protein bcere0029_16680 [Bacillus cereus AH1272]
MLFDVLGLKVALDVGVLSSISTDTFETSLPMFFTNKLYVSYTPCFGCTACLFEL